ncbi:MAG: hypothetical protein V3U86_05580 [Acidobacteriota bacterium]
MNQDLEHLRLLSIFHYVLAGFGFLFSLFPIIYLVLGGLMVTGSLPESANASGGLDQQFAGWIFLAVGAGMMLFGLVFATGLFLGGRFLAARRHHTFCVVVAAVSCFCMPLGTLLGVFTLIVLTRDSVKALFEGPQAAAAGG